jgi:hypothetical protein
MITEERLDEIGPGLEACVISTKCNDAAVFEST